jgi:hypothetical protein
VYTKLGHVLEPGPEVLEFENSAKIGTVGFEI